MWKKRLISAFIALNLFTVLYANLPVKLGEAGRRALAALPPPVASVLRTAGGLDGAYGSVVGLNSVWTFFSNPHRTDQRIVIKAEYADGAAVTLPIAGQGDRAFWDRRLFDFKEGNFRMSLLLNSRVRASYSRYLARQYPAHDGSPIKAVVWEGTAQDVLPPYETAARGTHLDPRVHTLRPEVYPPN